MRSYSEYKFRAKQEALNLYFLASQPKFTSEQPFFAPLPDPYATAKLLKGSKFEAETIAVAQKLLSGHYPLFGVELEIGRKINWRRDYRHEKESSAAYFRRIPYLDFNLVGDHKFVWELNRHQHLVALAQAFRMTDESRYLGEILVQLESWFEQNPFQRGINWTSALEVAFRVLSWIWIYHLLGSDLPSNARRSLVSGIFQHGLHLAANLSVYFSPNTHLLGEAVALHSIAVCFPAMPGASRWRKISEAIVRRQFQTQIRGDGSHFEQSTYYHVYALDFFLWFYLFSDRPKELEEPIQRMATYLFWTLGPSRRISFLGDDDGGRFFHPYGRRSEFGRSTLATCGALFGNAQWLGDRDCLAQGALWWLGPEALATSVYCPTTPEGGRYFQDSGSVFLQNADIFLHFDAGPFGYGGAGHSHADTLSFCVAHQGHDLLIDPGTYTYVGADRNWFRGTSAHNTVTVDSRDQAIPQTPFRWAEKPEAELLGWGSMASGGWLEAECRYSGVRHRRQVMLEGNSIQVIDELDGLNVGNTTEQRWHWAGETPSTLVLSSSSLSYEETSRFSPAYGCASASKATVVRETSNMPVKIATIFAPSPKSITKDAADRRFDNFRNPGLF